MAKENYIKTETLLGAVYMYKNAVGRKQSKSEEIKNYKNTFIMPNLA